MHEILANYTLNMGQAYQLNTLTKANIYSSDKLIAIV